MRPSTALLAVLVALIPVAAARADVPCGVIETRFQPGSPNLQIVTWLEDAAGDFLATTYITRVTGQFGLGNRPGAALLKTDFRWPYGRREMVAPVWAHRHGHPYPRVVMGGVCGNSPASLCPGGRACDIGLPQCGNVVSCDCEEGTIAYHALVSSYEPFYCSPSGAMRVDAMSCASPFTGSKGAYAAPPAISNYPPRADLTVKTAADSPDVLDFASKNDLVAISQATPPVGKPLTPPVDYYPTALAEGDYVAWIELSQESDFNAAHNHPAMVDGVQQWDFEGHNFLGQPSVIYKVPFHYDAAGTSAVATGYAGYGTWDGSDGVLHSPDGSINTSAAGTGAGRLVDVNDGADVYRVKVVVGACSPPDMSGPQDGGGGDGGAGSDGGTDGGSPPPRDAGPASHDAATACKAPGAVVGLTLVPSANAIAVRFTEPSAGAPVSTYAVKYQESTSPISAAEFDLKISGPAFSGGAPGAMVSTEIDGLVPARSYAVAVRASSGNCNGPVVSFVVKTSEAMFTVLHGCFVATAAYGSPLEPEVRALRRFRDERLLSSPLGRLFVATYYATSPPAAAAIARDPRLRAAARAALAPLLRLVDAIQDR